MDDSTCTIRIRASASKLVFEVAGRLDQDVAATFESQLRAGLWARSNSVLLDLGELTFIDDHGLRVLFAVSRLSSALDDKLRIRRRMAPEVERALEHSGDMSVLPLEPAESEPS
jgi:anti-anti-sigma factor